MKKLLKMISGTVLIAAMCFSLAGCGGSKQENTDAQPTESVTEETSAETDAPGDADAQTDADAQDDVDAQTDADVQDDAEGNTAETDTIEGYVAGMQSQFDSMAESMKESGLDMKVEARDKSVVYKYQYITDVGDIDVVKEALEASIEAMDTTFEGYLEALKAAVPDAESIILEYYSAGGELITSKEYK